MEFSEFKEESLWIAVIAQAIQDSWIDVSNCSDKAKKYNTILINDAKDWMIKENENFKIVCDLAGLDRAFVRSIYLYYADKPKNRRKSILI